MSRTIPLFTLISLALLLPSGTAEPTCLPSSDGAVCTGENQGGGDDAAICRGTYVDAYAHAGGDTWAYVQACAAAGPTLHTLAATGATGLLLNERASAIDLTASSPSSGESRLDWDGGVSQRLDVYRDGALRLNVLNTGRLSEFGLSPGTYTYQVCEGGLDVCSNEARVMVG